MADSEGRIPAGVTISVADPMPGIEADPISLLQDLADRTHVAAMQEFGRRPGCTWEGFAGKAERGTFATLMAELNTPAELVIEHLAAWDEALSPYAVVHVTPIPVH